MPKLLSDETDDTDTSTDPSTETESGELESVSEDETTPTDPTDDEDEEIESPDAEEDELIDTKVPFHKIPRFRELNDKVKALEAELAASKAASAEEKRLANATPQEKAVAELINTYGLAPKSEVEKVKNDMAAYKDSQEFEKFLVKYPDAASKAAVLKALAFTPAYSKTSYEDIYKEVFTTVAAPAADRKVLARRKTGGMKPLAGSNKTAEEKIPTAREIKDMPDSEYEKNRVQIQKWLAEGKIR